MDCRTIERIHPTAPPSKGIVVIIPDAFGWTLPNSRILADRYAERGGWRVLLPDSMDDMLPFCIQGGIGERRKGSPDADGEIGYKVD